MKTEGASGRTRKMNIRDYTVYIAFVAFFLIFTITLRNVGNGFANPNNLMNILRQTCLSAVMSVGMCCVIGAGQIDLSIGYVVGLSSVLTAMALNSWGIVPAILVGLAVGFVAGAVNGFLIAYLKLPAFLATLGTQMIWQGASRTISTSRRSPSSMKRSSTSLAAAISAWSRCCSCGCSSFASLAGSC